MNVLLTNLYFSLVHYFWIGYNAYTGELVGGACDGLSKFHNFQEESYDKYQCVYFSAQSSNWYPKSCSTDEMRKYVLCERNVGDKSDFETLCSAGSK